MSPKPRIFISFLVAAFFLSGCHYFSSSFESAASLDNDGKGPQAIEAYEKYLKLHFSGPLAARATYRVAKNYEAQTDYTNAILWYEKVLNEFPGSEEETLSLLDLASLYREKLKDSAKSMEFSQRAFVKYMDHPGAKGATEELVEAQFTTAKALFDRKEYRKAFETAGSIFQTYPSSFVGVETRAKVDNLSDRARRGDLLAKSSVDLVFLSKEEPYSKALEQEFLPSYTLADRIPSPDGKFIVERKKASNGTFHLFLAQVPIKGDKLVFKVLKPTFGAGLPSWSPDSKSLIYVRTWGGRRKLDRTEIVSKKTQTLFWTQESRFLGTVASFHPSGNMIAFVYGQKVWVMNPNAFKTLLKSRENLSYTAGLVWSKDGTMVRYWDQKPGQKTRIEGVLHLDANVIP